MTVDEAIEQLQMISRQGQGDLSLVNDEDHELTDLIVDSYDDQSGLAVVVEFDSHQRDYYG